MKKKIQDQYTKQRNTIMDYNYNKSTEKVYRALQKEYKRVLDEVNAELLKLKTDCTVCAAC